MIHARQPIPTWYQDDWRPAAGPNEMPTMTWGTISEIVDRLAPNAARRSVGRALFRTLRQEAASLSPMALLQQLVLTAALMMSPHATPPSGPSPDIGGPDTPLPRWSFTDVEVALSCCATGLQRSVALERHHDLLQMWGLEPAPETVMRAVFLIAFGISVRPSSAASADAATTGSVSPIRRRASA